MVNKDGKGAQMTASSITWPLSEAMPYHLYRPGHQFSPALCLHGNSGLRQNRGRKKEKLQKHISNESLVMPVEISVF